MHGRGGFTLIELLVVIAIVAILAAILFPIFVSAKQKAYESECLSNLRQIGVATTAYMSDYGGRFPPWMARDSDWPYGTWLVELKKYARTKLLAKCPADGVTAETAPISYWKNVYTDYWSGAGGFNKTTAPPLETSFRYTKTTCYLMDGPNRGEGNHTWWGPPRTWGGDSRYTNYAKAAKEAESRHSGSANVLFCDWHVRRVPPQEWTSTRTNSAAGDPLKAAINYAVPSPWCNSNDGTHAWFRPN